MVEENSRIFNKPINSTKLLVVYAEKQKRCQAFVTDAGNLITMVDMVQTGVTHVVAIGVMWDAYCNCKCILQAERNWNHWKGHFNDAFNELKQWNAITIESIGYEAHNIAKKTFTDDVTMALDNLVSAAIFKTDAIETLVATNKQLAEALANITKENEKQSSMLDQLTKETTKPKP